MDSKQRHEAQVDPAILETFRNIQLELKEKLVFPNEKDIINEKDIKYVGALDISFSQKVPDMAVVVFVVYDYHQFISRPKKITPVYTDNMQVEMTVPYIPGYLAFREVPHYINMLTRLKMNKPEFYPQLLLIDGNGILHTHQFGCACHLGAITDLITIGISKTFFNIDGLYEDLIKEQFMKQCSKKGDHLDIVGNSGKIWGCALKTTDEKSKTCVYISVGNKININSAMQIVKNTCLYKYPEPIRVADLTGRDIIRKLDAPQKKNL
jgi:deoxyinosine 3'endonuclease (endonuclease V)